MTLKQAALTATIVVLAISGYCTWIALSPKETAIKIITWSVIIAVHFIAWAFIFLFLAKNTTNSND
jgi:hypothetical protein